MSDSKPERARESRTASQREPEWARESQREPDSEPERARVSQREPERAGQRARKSQSEPERAGESQRESERAGPNWYYQWWLTSKIQLLNPQTFYILYIAGWHKLQLCIWEADYKKRGWPHIFSMPQHCFVAKQSNMTLFCRETLKYDTFCRETLKFGTFCRETLKYGTFCRETLKYALWAEKMAKIKFRADCLCSSEMIFVTSITSSACVKLLSLG